MASSPAALRAAEKQLGSSNGGRASEAQLSANGAFFFSAFALRMRSNGSGGMVRERAARALGARPLAPQRAQQRRAALSPAPHHTRAGRESRLARAR